MSLLRAVLHRTLGLSIILMAVGALLVFAGGVAADQPEDLHCPAGWLTKDDSGADDNDLVPAADLLICVKAGSPSSNDSDVGNTGIIVSDGESTLREYLFAAGIVDGSGTQGRDVSYWVIYETMPSEEPSVVPSEEPSVVPSEEPSEEPSVVPSEEPSEEASVLPSEEASQPTSASPSESGGVLPGNPTPTPGQLPDTSTTTTGVGLSLIGLVVMLGGSMLALASSAVRRDR
jgi:hypothetical protein